MSEVTNTPVVYKCCSAECSIYLCMIRVYRPHQEYSEYNIGYWFDVDYCYMHNRLYHWSLDVLAANITSAFFTQYYAQQNYLHWSRMLPIMDKWEKIDKYKNISNLLLEDGLEILDLAAMVTDYVATDIDYGVPCFCNLHLFYMLFCGNAFLTPAERGMCCVMFLGIQNPVCFCHRSKYAQLAQVGYLTTNYSDSSLARFRCIHESGAAVCGGEADIEVLSYPS